METTDRLNAVVEEVIRLRRSGVIVSFDKIEAKYADLMPELHDRLQSLEAIEEARSRARSQSNSSSDGGSRPDSGMAILQKALPQYEILDEIHRGGQGIVFRAVQASTQRIIALKVMLGGPFASDRQIQRFSREAELVARLQHPHIVTLFESGVVEGRPFLAMEYVDGQTINDYVLLHDLGVRDRVALLAKVARAVHAAHMHGVIHRDLKPTNILVDVEGQPRVLDFGFAKDSWSEPTNDLGESISIEGHIVGTLPYLSPEQARGEGAVDMRCDVYALGVVLFQLITDTFPYSVDGSIEETRQNILTSEPQTLGQALRLHSSDVLEPGEVIHNDLEAVVRKSLEKEQAQRYQTAGDFADDLERFLSGEGVQARADKTLYLLQKKIRRYRKQMLVTALVTMALFVGLASTFVMWRSAIGQTRTYQKALSMASFDQLASVDRDAGQTEKAIDGFNMIIELGETLPGDDRYVQEYLYKAHHKLAEIYMGDGMLAKARLHCTTAVNIANALVRKNPSDDEWIRQHAFSLLLLGKMHLHGDELLKAIDCFTQATREFDQILSRHPGEAQHLRSLASLKREHGKALRKLKRFDLAIEKYLLAVALSEAACEIEKKGDNLIDMVASLNSLSAGYISRKQKRDICEAQHHLHRAATILEELRINQTIYRQRDFSDLERRIAHNVKIVKKYDSECD